MSDRPEMKSVAVKRDIYLDIDAALDTRIGTLARLNQTLAYHALRKQYHLRRRDSFDGVDDKVFEELYAKRDTETLKHSVVTNIFHSIREMIIGAAMADAQRNRDIHCTVVLNTWPYTLNSQEVELFREMVKRQLFAQIGVEVVHLSPAELTPTHCSDKYGVMIKYDYYWWLETQHQLGTLVRGAALMHSVKLLVPNIWFSAVLTDEQIDELRNSVGMAPLEEMELMLRQLADAEMIPVSHFSVLSDTIDGHIVPPSTAAKKAESMEDGKTLAENG